MPTLNKCLGALALIHGFSMSAWADSGHHANSSTVDSHAPIGVMGDHRHQAGEWMFSYRFMTMAMEDNLQGDDEITADNIVTRIATPSGVPPTLRVVPTKMRTQMHMVGVMYAPNDSLTLMAMFNYIDKEMDHLTFRGMAGSERLGNFTTKTSGMGDTKVALLWGLSEQGSHSLHLNLGLSLPTGDIEERGEVLSPMNTRPTLRLPYAMQLGSGTYDIEPGLTYRGDAGRLGWGSQYRATLRLGENNEDYSLGDIHQLSGWTSYRFADSLSGSLRLTYRDEDQIDGRDPNIGAPVQTADPRNYGSRRLNLGIGANLLGQSGALRGHRLALEYELPLMQEVNGVHMEMQSMLTLGYQYAF